MASARPRRPMRPNRSRRTTVLVSMRLAAALLLALELRRRCRRARVRLLVLLRLRMMNNECNYILSRSLPSPSESAWYGIYRSRDQSSFIATVSIPYDAFNELLGVFARHYVICSGLGKRGRPPVFVVKHAGLHA